MKQLEDILIGIEHEVISGNTDDLMINEICFDSRKVRKNDLFVAVRGTQTDGHQYVESAIESGARCIIVEDAKGIADQQEVCIIKCKDNAETLGLLASNYFDQPSHSLNITGITGTNGKSSTVYLLYQTFIALGYKSALMGTVEVLINGKSYPATHTTPDPVQLNQLLHKMLEAEVEYVFMEVSSHALHQKRTAGIRFSNAIFTNITHDHLDYHKTFQHYIDAKKLLFDGLDSEAIALVNADDRHSSYMLQNCSAEKLSYSLHKLSDYRFTILDNSIEGLDLEHENQAFHSPLIGKFNAYNLAATFSRTLQTHSNSQEVMAALSTASGAPGRFNVRQADGINYIVDYAHTPDALENVLKTLVDITEGQKVILVFGCGGDRDREKRPKMGKIASKYADKIIITSDNPRTEDPYSIIEEIESGIKAEDKFKCLSIENRKEAIKTACNIAMQGDVILIAGKGHEKYQIIGTEKHEFDDQAIVLEFLNKISA